MKQDNIFESVKQELKQNLPKLTQLFQCSKQKGNRLYFDAPQFDSFYLDTNTLLGIDHRTGKGFDIFGLHQYLYQSPSKYQSLLKIVTELNLNIDLNRFKSSCSNKNKKSNDPYQKMLSLFERSRKLAGTMSEEYLIARGIKKDLTNEEWLRHSDEGWVRNQTDDGFDKYPMFVQAITNYPEQKIISLQKTFLEYEDKEAIKANIGNPRRFQFGCSAKGGSVKVGKKFERSGSLIICEGVETGLTIAEATNEPVWCVCSANNMWNIDLPGVEDVSLIKVATDLDKTSEVNAAALSRRLIKQGYETLIYNTLRVDEDENLPF